ncbi:hypothetical protein CVT24_005991 [Panaeolus cyanescens]|uniref:CSC1/OSCA1-like 7TM region domain-containing protein n=1 Tax=Panaeolus cyanescens TaxID=181874 RepID=A0A409VCU0_9AGAR|nr:hypothetical protein CVT24_005991 [Panaeolus cyanescens]
MNSRQGFDRRLDANDIQQLLNTTNSLEPKAVVTQSDNSSDHTSPATVQLITILAFNFLRPKNKIVYQPKVTYHAPTKSPPKISSSFCGWIPPLLHTHEPELFYRIGLDALGFLRFLHLLRWLFTWTAVIVCAGLLPINFIQTMANKPPQYDLLSAMTIRDIHGVWLYAHIVAVYLITSLFLVMVYHHWKVMYRLRYDWFRSQEYQQSFYARTLHITNIPPRRRSDEGLYKIMSSLHLRHPVNSVHIARHAGCLPKLVAKHNEAVEGLEKLLLKFESKGGERPTIRVGGFLGIGAQKEDAIAYHIAKMRHTEAMVEQYRAQMDRNRPESYGFVSMASIPHAHETAIELQGQHPKGISIRLAPHPSDIFWDNVGHSRNTLRFRRAIGFGILLMLCTLSLVPMLPIASLANLDAIAASGYIPFLSQWVQTSPTTYSIVSGVLPPAIAAIYGSILPGLMRRLSKFMGSPSHSQLDRVVVARYFGFLVASQLLIFSILGVVFNAVLEIIIAVQEEGVSLALVLSNIDRLPERITRTYVDQTSFWLKWFPLRGFLTIFDLAQVFTLLWVSLKSCTFGRTAREIKEDTKPPLFPFAVHYCNLLFMATVGLLFAPLAPLIALAAAVVFWLCSWIYKYQLMYVFVTRVETGGRLWNVVINRLLFATGCMQVIMILTIGFQAQFKSLQFLASIPPLPALIVFKVYLNKRFANDFQYYVPRHEESTRAYFHSEEADIMGHKLESRYTNPALYSALQTPMVYKTTLRLLRRIYHSSNFSNSQSVLSRGIDDVPRRTRRESTSNRDVMNGVMFDGINEHEPYYDPMLYQRDREEVDCDLDSVTLMPEGEYNGYRGLERGLSYTEPTLPQRSERKTRQRSTLPSTSLGPEIMERKYYEEPNRSRRHPRQSSYAVDNRMHDSEGVHRHPMPRDIQNEAVESLYRHVEQATHHQPTRSRSRHPSTTDNVRRHSSSRYRRERAARQDSPRGRHDNYDPS